MSNPDRPVELEVVAVGVPMTIRMRDTIVAYSESHKDGKGQAPSTADLMRRAIAQVVRYDLAAETAERNLYSERKTYATEAERIQHKKDKAAEDKRIKDAALALWNGKSKSEQAAILRASLERNK